MQTNYILRFRVFASIFELHQAIIHHSDYIVPKTNSKNCFTISTSVILLSNVSSKMDDAEHHNQVTY